MAYYYGWVSVDVTSYDTFRNAVNGNGFDCDNLYGAQCIDLFMLLNYNIGGYSAGYYDGPPYVKAGPNEYVSECWTVTASRTYNAASNYDLITDVTKLKRGDMIILSGTFVNPPGHNAFCDEDYNPNHPTTISCLGQNQGGAYFPTGGACANVTDLYLTNFLGAFRLKRWQGPSPEPTVKKHKFPWFIYAERRRTGL